ncbi:Membrane protein [Mycobacteroides abscessus subsp. abscessus]|nr:Membrane protein [Mycobacteroides abscessus subsp. abscessus]
METKASPWPAYRLAAMLLGVGVVHFVAPKPFDDIVPAGLPGDPRLYTYASGVAELGTGALLLAPKTRRLGAIARLPLQIPMITEALKVRRTA